MTTTIAYSTGKLYRVKWAMFSVAVAATSARSAGEAFRAWVLDQHGMTVEQNRLWSIHQTNGINSGDVLLISQPTMEA